MQGAASMRALLRQTGIKLSGLPAKVPGIRFFLVPGFLVAAHLFVGIGNAAPGADAIHAGLFLRQTNGETAYVAPVLSSDVFIEVIGDIAKVTVRQRFRNPSENNSHAPRSNLKSSPSSQEENSRSLSIAQVALQLFSLNHSPPLRQLGKNPLHLNLIPHLVTPLHLPLQELFLQIHVDW